MENNPSKFKQKNWCSSDDCEVVITGFIWNDIYVCKKCKLEISEDLYNRIKYKEDTKKDIIDIWDEF
jgi:hypothetical protein